MKSQLKLNCLSDGTIPLKRVLALQCFNQNCEDHATCALIFSSVSFQSGIFIHCLYSHVCAECMNVSVLSYAMCQIYVAGYVRGEVNYLWWEMVIRCSQFDYSFSTIDLDIGLSVKRFNSITYSLTLSSEWMENDFSFILDTNFEAVLHIIPNTKPILNHSFHISKLH